MANVKGLNSDTKSIDAKDTVVKWTLGNDDTGVDEKNEWLRISKLSDKTIHVYGTWGGAELNVMGSNETETSEPANAIVLTDPQGNAITKIANFIETIMENPSKIAPVTSGGTGTNLTVIITAKGDIR